MWTGESRVGSVAVAKPAGGVRRLAVLRSEDEMRYRSLVAPIARSLESRLAAPVTANRLAGDPEALELEPWRDAWRRHRLALRALVERTRRSGHDAVVLLADVRACYASVRDEILEERLVALGGHPSEAGSIVRFLARLRAGGAGPGLPIGPDPSAVLANAVLAPVDRAIADEGVGHVRWVDDVAAVVPDEAVGARLLERLRETLASLGLRLAEEKIRVVDPSVTAVAASGQPPARTAKHGTIA